MVEFRVLGDVQAVVDDGLIDLGHARQRCVLVALLVNVNRVVSVDQLVDRVWGPRAPQRPRDALYVYVSRLRQSLAVSDQVRIVHKPTGYVLVVDPLVVDLHQFQHLTGQARATKDAEALALFERALRLWRGEPFAALDTEWLASVRDDLNRQRLAAELDRNDLALRQGRHTELLAALASTAATCPLDERLAGQLMLALYRSGRQADALAHYQQLRLRLADELGADPNPTLQHLHQQILTTDPTLAVPSSPSTGSTTGPVMPRQLPAPPHSFTGRTDELTRLDALLSTTQDEHPTAVVISAVSGTAGIGKTALAVHWAHQVADRFPDGQLYANLRGFDATGQVLDPTAAIRGFLDALGVAPQSIPLDPEAQAALYRSQLAGRRLLVVLDNARDSAQVRPLLPGTPGCLVLVTSRNQLPGLVASDGARPLALDLLTTTQALELLTGRLDAERITAEPDAVAEIITHCARLPLALTIVAARAATHPRLPLHTFASELRAANGRLDVLTTDDPMTDIRAVFSWSYQTLTPDAARLFRLLGVHPGPDLSTAAAASLAALPLQQVRMLLAELARANLIIEHIPGRYTLHDLLRTYATDLAHTADTDQQRDAAIHRMLDHYLHTAYIAERLLNSVRDTITLTPPQPGATPEHPADHQQAIAWFTTERPVLLATVTHAATTGFHTHTWQLAWTLAVFLDLSGHWHDWIATGRTAVAAAHRLADPDAQARARHHLGTACAKSGCFDDAYTHLRHALDLTTQAGDLIGQAHLHSSLSYLWQRQSDHTQALDHAQQALRLYQATGYRYGRANALNAIGWSHALLGDHQEALTTCQQALALHQIHRDGYGQAHAWDSIGYAHHHLGHHTEAITSYQHALNLFQEIGDRYLKASTLDHLGDIHHATGNPHAARTAWQHALAILDQLHHPDADHVRAKLATLDSEPRNCPGHGQP